jgi:branched-chain amino acid transport system ATP-binding protein
MARQDHLRQHGDGYLKPSAGRILLAGEDITRRSPREITRRGVARSFQIPQLCLHMTVLENMLTACTAAARRDTS